MKKILTLLLILSGTIAYAQSPCDSLDIKVNYYPFSDTLIQINVVNSGQTFFGYPQFTIFDSNGDTVAVESLALFGIASQSQHVLDVYPGIIPDSFSGTLQLIYATVDSYAVCTWPMTFDLCPDTCRMFYTYLMNSGGMEVTGDAAWEILDADSVTVASGTFTLDTNNQYTTDSACLSSGEYFLKIVNTSLTMGGQKSFGITTFMLPAPNPQMDFNNLDSTYLAFTLYEACMAPVSVKETKIKTTVMDIYSFGDNIYISNPAKEAIGDIAVYSIDGKKIWSSSTQSATRTIDLSGYATGIYILRIANKNGTIAKKLYIE